MSHSPETRAKMAAAARARWAALTPEQRKVRAPRPPLRHSKDTISRLTALRIERLDAMTPAEHAEHAAAISRGHARRRLRAMGPDLLQLISRPSWLIRADQLAALHANQVPVQAPRAFHPLPLPCHIARDLITITAPASTLATLRRWLRATIAEETAPGRPGSELTVAIDHPHTALLHGWRQVLGHSGTVRIHGVRHTPAPGLVRFVTPDGRDTLDTVCLLVPHTGPTVPLLPPEGWAQAGEVPPVRSERSA